MTPRPALPIRTALAVAALAAAGLSIGCPRAESPPPVTERPSSSPKPTPQAPVTAEDSGYDFRGTERAAVDRYLRANPDLRAATDEDRRPADDETALRALYGVYHPYFVRGDANDDGGLDFLLGFVRRDSDPDAPWFTIVLFSGRPDGTFEAGNPVERDISLADGDLSIDRDAIIVTPDTAEDEARRYRWDPDRGRHVFVRDEPEEPPSPPPART
jgi:hypothetical protein